MIRFHLYMPCCLALALGLCGCGPAAPAFSPVVVTGTGGPLVIAVIGSAITAEKPLDHKHNPHQAIAMWDGARVAFETAPELDMLRRFVRVEAYDDGGDEGKAEQLARQIQTDPRVIAVIGHSSSAATRRAAQLYHQAGIPLIMPIATGPLVMYPPTTGVPSEDQRLQNCFRLPPSDAVAQPRAIEHFVRDHLGSDEGRQIVTPAPRKSIEVVADFSPNASEYSHNLAEQVKKRLGLLGNVTEVGNEQKGPTVRDAVSRVASADPGLIIFCGYGDMARDFMNQLKPWYKDRKEATRPRILFTDGCKYPVLNTDGFKAYLSFPLPPLAELSGPGPDALKRQMQPGQTESFELFGYDAMLIVARAFKECPPSRVSRHTLRRALNDPDLVVKGLARKYEFRHGETRDPVYYIYECMTLQKEDGRETLYRKVERYNLGDDAHRSAR